MYSKIISNLVSNKNFSFSRFGDGEMSCVFGKSGHNCDQHEYYPDLGKALMNVLNNPRGLIGIQRLASTMFNVDQFDIDWVDADCIHRASINGELDKLFDALKDREVILVGAGHLKQLTDIYQTFIEVPKINAWLEYERIKQEIERISLQDDVILYACGMMAEVLIWDLHSSEYTQIDVGSVFDPYAGVNSRNYHKKLKL